VSVGLDGCEVNGPPRVARVGRRSRFDKAVMVKGPDKVQKAAA
jgi:hypothetical protein